ncbi:zinc finger, CCHC-type containing protein, partial [Tanacetum coccineum]
MCFAPGGERSKGESHGRIVLSIEDKLNYLEQPLPPVPVAPEGQQVAPELIAAHTAWIKGSKEIAGLMLMTMEPEIQRNLENLHAYEMLQELKTLYSQQAEQELLQTTRDFHSCKQEEGQSVSSYELLVLLKLLSKLYTLAQKQRSCAYAIRAGKVQKRSLEEELSLVFSRVEKKEKNAALEMVGSDNLEGSRIIAHRTPHLPLHNTMVWRRGRTEPITRYGYVRSSNKEKTKKEKIRRPTDHICLYIDAEEQDNKVWDLVELPPNGKTVGSKWLFKKKIDMDGVVHTYKAHIRAIRILIAIAAFYDYKIWQMDVKTAFLNGYLSEEGFLYTDAGLLPEADASSLRLECVNVLELEVLLIGRVKQSIFATSSIEEVSIIAAYELLKT